MNQDIFKRKEKEYERTIRGEFVAVRLDMENGRYVCKLHKQPYDDVFLDSIIDTFEALVEFIPNISAGFTIWDEINLVWPVSSSWEKNRLLKICSIISAYATKELNKAYRKRTTHGSVYESTVDNLYFDCRAFSLSKSEILPYLQDRQNKNVYGNIHWKAKQYFEDKVVQQHKTEEAKRELLKSVNADFDDDPKKYSYGVLFLQNNGVNKKSGDFRNLN